MDNLDPQTRAKAIIAKYFNDRIGSMPNHEDIPALTMRDVIVSRFDTEARGWKATLITNIPDQTHYEVAYNGFLNEIVIREFRKIDEMTVSADEVD